MSQPASQLILRIVILIFKNRPKVFFLVCQKCLIRGLLGKKLYKYDLDLDLTSFFNVILI
jgi:hypothetical protein